MQFTMALKSVLDATTDADPLRRVIMQRIDLMSPRVSAASSFSNFEDAFLDTSNIYDPGEIFPHERDKVIEVESTTKDKTNARVPYWMKGESRSALDEAGLDMIHFDNTVTPPSAMRTETFHCFPNLPTELRLQIWKEAAHLPRILEMGRPDHSNVLNCQMLLASRLPPAMLLVNHEAYEEGLKHYRLRNFDIHANTWVNRFQDLDRVKKPVYYNPKADIIFFGINCDMWSVQGVCNTQRAAGNTIPRVALKHIWDPCNNIRHGCLMGCLGLLHGFELSNDIDISHLPPEDYPGCPGLSEVFIIMQPNSMFSPEPYRHVRKHVGVGPCIELRPASPSTLLYRAKPDYNYLQEQIQRVANDFALPNDDSHTRYTSKNLWLGDDKPTISLVKFEVSPFSRSLCLDSVDITAQHHILQSLMDSGDQTRDIRCYGSKISVVDCSAGGYVTIGMFGDAESNYKTKMAIFKFVEFKQTPLISTAPRKVYRKDRSFDWGQEPWP